MPDELVVLGRDHRFGDGTAAVERARAAGFAVSADFILGTPLTSRRADAAARATGSPTTCRSTS